LLAVAAAALSVFVPACRPEPGQLRYPVAPKGNVVDTYHGLEVPDPYRWLEEPDSEETLAWVGQQNKLTAEYLSTPASDKIVKRLTDLWDYPKYSAPAKKAGRYFFWKNDGLQNQDVLYMQNKPQDEPTVVINPNLLSEDGTLAVARTALSEDARLLAYGLSQSGSDWQRIKIRRVDSQTDSDETLLWCRWPGIAWKHDNTGFFYDRFPEPNSVPPEDRNNYNRVYFHLLATPQSEDVLIYEDPENKELGFSPIVTEDGKFLILYVYHGTDPNNRVYYRPVGSSESFVKLLDKADARYDFIGNLDSTFYFHTNLDAPRGRIIAIDVNNPACDNWRQIIPQQDDVIDYVAFVNNHFVVAYMHDVHHLLKIFDLDGTLVRDIALPTLGTVYGISGNQFDTEMFFSFASFLFPKTIYRYDFTTDQPAVFRKPQIDFEPSAYETRQLFYESRDSTRVPMFITYKKPLRLNGKNPTLLTGYGGFAIANNPYFSVSSVVWLEQGGIYAVANIRGGGEYGETWHKAGMLDKKQNCFDDFIAAAEFLIAENYTSSGKLATIGGSNGGLLTAVCMLQRPDLFGAVVPKVPVTDMLRFHKFTVGRYWIPEYGNAEADPEQFKYLYAYSPLHNVREAVPYPPILVTSADTDDRVAPAHAKKFVATLQGKTRADNPILLRVETKAGHGHGKPTAKKIQEAADTYTFLFKALGIPCDPNF